MQGRSMIAQLILEIHNDAISDISGDLWDGPLTIDAHDWARLHPIRICGDPGHIEVVCDSGSMSNYTEAKKGDDD